MIERYRLRTLLRRLEHFPAVALLGPHQSGKTTLAIHIAAHGLSEREALNPELARASYYRTAAGAEIDLVLEMPGGAL